MGHCYQKIEINCPIEQVWQTLSNFHDMSWAPGVVNDVTIVGDKGPFERGSQRILNNLFHETLIVINAKDYSFSYSIDDGPGPIAKNEVDNYVGVVKLTELTAGTLVEWGSSFDSGNESQVIDFCNPIYAALLNALKIHLTPA
ncbi:SRPBCC family protein [Thalassotalea sp. PLHSN55]|uniref:SRPBCC family protein n=1 Tax=Thalassotalea sp. PLHSN55 TaxID=3435888 RepID=UPI003F83F519